MSKSVFFSYLFIALAILERPLVVKFGLNGIHVIAEITMLLATIEYVWERGFRAAFSSFPVVIWGIWIAYSLVNWYFFSEVRNPSLYEPLYTLKRFMLPISMLIIAYFEGNRNLNKLLKFILMIMSLYIIIGLVFQNSAVGVSIEERGGELLGNELPLVACVMSFFAFLAYRRRMIPFWIVVFLNVLVLTAIFSMATRKALGAWLIIFVFSVMASVSNRKPSTIIVMILVVLGLYWGYGYVMDNTIMGQRMGMIEYASSGYLNDNSSLFLRAMGDRAIFYTSGWKLFTENPINGIGITNFVAYNLSDNRIHSEYMVELCENGILGTMLYVVFMLSIINSVFRSFRYEQREIVMVCLGGMVAILFISFYAWTYDVVYYFLLYGVVLSVCRPLNTYRA